MATASNLITVLFEELSRREDFIPLGDQRPRSRVGVRERRALKRQAAGGSGSLYWTDPYGRCGVSAVVARNVTEKDIQLEAPKQVPVPATVRLSGQTLECVGSACYRRRAGEKYLVGILLFGQPYGKQARRLHEPILTDRPDSA